MSITRINEFQAKADTSETLLTFLKSIMPIIEASPGCESCRLLRDVEAPTRFVIIETWQSIEAHQASVKNIPPKKLQEAMDLVASPPNGAYYQDE